MKRDTMYNLSRSELTPTCNLFRTIMVTGIRMSENDVHPAMLRSIIQMSALQFLSFQGSNSQGPRTVTISDSAEDRGVLTGRKYKNCYSSG